MIDYPVFFGLWAIVAVFYILNRSPKINGAENVLIDDGDKVFFRDYPISRILKLRGKLIYKQDIVRVQQAPRCVSLFTGSGNAYDIWLPKGTVDEVSSKAQMLFTDAKFNKVD